MKSLKYQLIENRERLQRLAAPEECGANPVDQCAGEFGRNKILNTAEAAAFLNFSIPHFRRLYRAGVVPVPIQLGARKLGWKTGDLIDWVGSRHSRPMTGEVHNE